MIKPQLPTALSSSAKAPSIDFSSAVVPLSAPALLLPPIVPSKLRAPKWSHTLLRESQLRKLSINICCYSFYGRTFLFPGRRIWNQNNGACWDFFSSHLIVYLNGKICKLINTVSFSYTFSRSRDLRLSSDKETLVPVLLTTLCPVAWAPAPPPN